MENASRDQFSAFTSTNFENTLFGYACLPSPDARALRDERSLEINGAIQPRKPVAQIEKGLAKLGELMSAEAALSKPMSSE